jgi:hypothetical protein
MAPLFFWRSQRSRVAVRFDLSRIATQAFGYQSMHRFGLYAALTLCVGGLTATAAAERFGRWSLDQPGDFIFALSSKRTISFDDRTATSELAFVCHQENKYVAVLLIPVDGTFNSRHEAIPVAVQKIEDQSDPSDLMQRWENGPGYIFLESPDEQEQLASYLKDREAEGVKSVHFYFPNDLDASTQTTNHMVVDVAGFSSGVAKFTSRCEQAQ